MSDLGKLLKDEHGYGIVLERIYKHPVEKVWDALTDPAKMTHWFLDVKWDFRVGGVAEFTFQDKDRTKTYGRITAIDPLKVLEYLWHNDDGFPDELARWELFAEGKNTRLVLTYTRVRESFAVSVTAGWHMVLDDFGDFLEGRLDFPPFGGESEPTEGQKATETAYKELYDQTFKR